MRNKLLVLVVALGLLIGVGAVAQTDETKAQQATLQNLVEITVVGENLYYDSKSMTIMSQQVLDGYIEESMITKNGVDIRSGVLVGWVLSYKGLLKALDGKSPSQMLTMLSQNKTVINRRGSTGGDTVVAWSGTIQKGLGSFPAPNARGFNWGYGLSAVPTGAATVDPYSTVNYGSYADAHESHHGLGLLDHSEFIASDGSCGFMDDKCIPMMPFTSGPNVRYGLPVNGQRPVWGDAAHNNVAIANSKRALVAGYVKTPPKSLEKTCNENIETACLGSLIVRIQPTSLDNASMGYTMLASSDGQKAIFLVGSAQVSVAVAKNLVNSAKLDVAINGARAPMPYRIWVIDTASGGLVRAWDSSQTGKVTKATILKIF